MATNSVSNEEFVIPGSKENYEILKRVNEIVDEYPPHAVERALKEAERRNTADAFDQILAENPDLYGIIYEAAEGIRLDAEEGRAFAKPDILRSSLKERAFGIFLEKPAFEVRLINAEGELGGEMFGNE